ncbi:MAG: diguanylate cyclase [Gammaproteobacteria bacterium]
MNEPGSEVAQLHWLLGILQNVDVGLVVLDRNCRIKLWNGFMENHSGVSAGHAMERDVFELVPELPRDWLQRKMASVSLLETSAYSTWQQRPYLLKFHSYRPVTGRSQWMYQNVTLFPLTSPQGQVEHVCMMLYDVTDMALDEQELLRTNQELERLSRTDGLTGLYNRRTWEDMLRSEFRRHQRSHQPGALVMFDIDHFKHINDTYGHPAGDAVLQRVAEVVRDTKRETDIAGRYGGEEFAIILLDTDDQGAMRFAERLRKAIAAATVRTDGKEISFTISLGVAGIVHVEGATYSHWLKAVDQALYRSKEGGRNRTTVYSGPT